MSRIPIRLRLTLPFAIGMALVLAATGVVIYIRVSGELISSVDQSLRVQLSELSAHAHEGEPLLDPDVSEGPTVAQVQLANGTVVSSSPTTLPHLLDAASLRGALAGRTLQRTTAIKGLPGDWRLRAGSLRVGGKPAVLVVGRSLSERAESLHRLGREFLLAAPLVLLVAILGGYALAAAALRPVEAMRKRAEAVTASTPGRRLPVPPARDEIAALAVTLNAMLERLEAALEHERRFVADASHELRTPLALLRAELELALRRPRSQHELEDAIRSAAEETERLSRLAEDLLLIARSDKGRIPIRPEHVQVTELLEHVRHRFSARAAALGRPLVVDSEGAALEADPVRIEQALGNLVDNALQHGRGPVTLSSARRNGMVELHVSDEGNGFPEGFVDRAFDRFSRADDSRSTHGTGLGLAIVALIAQAHGGEAHAANRANGGADVWLSLSANS
jgi:signal transduction histidine kinase